MVESEGKLQMREWKIISERVENWIATPRKRGKFTSEGMEEDRNRGRKEKHTTNTATTTTTSALDVIVKDLMDDILGKLPLRNLVRLKYVCKAWCNSIPRIAKSTYGPQKIIVTPDDSNSYTCIRLLILKLLLLFHPTLILILRLRKWSNGLSFL